MYKQRVHLGLLGDFLLDVRMSLNDFLQKVIDVLDGSDLKEFLVVPQGNPEGVLKSSDQVDDIQAVQFQVLEYPFFRRKFLFGNLKLFDKDLINAVFEYLAVHSDDLRY